MLSRHDQLAIAHATFACTAVLFTLPIALLAGRYLRSRGAIWFRIHRIFNSITTFLIMLVFGLGIGAVVSGGATPTTEFSGEGSDLHHRLGLSLFLLVMIQASLGVIAHSFSAGHLTRKIHITVGIITVPLLYWQVWEGMNNEWPETSDLGTSTPLAVKILFWIILGISVTAYVLAAAHALFAKSLATDSFLVEKNKLEEGQRSVT